jgi:hypothetical protein
MRIGRDENYLLMESSPVEGGYAVCRVEAVATASGQKFTASQDGLMIDSSDEILKRLADFESLKNERIELQLTGGGWLRLQRDARGYITVRYRISGWKTSAAMEGEILVEGEFAGSFCREFGALLRSQR